MTTAATMTPEQPATPESAGRKSFVPDEYFRITSKGRNALRMQNAPGEPPAREKE